MARVLKNIDYYKLIVLIYSFADYNKNKATVLFNYAAYHFKHYNFNEVYIERLALDLNLLNNDSNNLIEFNDTQSAYRSNLQEMDDTFNNFELIQIKTAMWDITHQGYYE